MVLWFKPVVGKRTLSPSSSKPVCRTDNGFTQVRTDSGSHEPKKRRANVIKCCCRGGACWWLSLGLGLVLLVPWVPGLVSFPLLFFSLSGDVPRTVPFQLWAAGVTFQLPDGRDVWSNRNFPVSPYVRRPCAPRLHCLPDDCHRPRFRVGG